MFPTEVTLRDYMPAITRLRGTAKPHLTGAAQRLLADRHERQRAVAVASTAAELFARAT